MFSIPAFLRLKWTWNYCCIVFSRAAWKSEQWMSLFLSHCSTNSPISPLLLHCSLVLAMSITLNIDVIQFFQPSGILPLILHCVIAHFADKRAFGTFFFPLSRLSFRWDRDEKCTCGQKSYTDLNRVFGQQPRITKQQRGWRMGWQKRWTWVRALLKRSGADGGEV